MNRFLGGHLLYAPSFPAAAPAAGGDCVNFGGGSAGAGVGEGEGEGEVLFQAGDEFVQAFDFPGGGGSIALGGEGAQAGAVLCALLLLCLRLQLLLQRGFFGLCCAALEAGAVRPAPADAPGYGSAAQRRSASHDRQREPPPPSAPGMRYHGILLPGSVVVAASHAGELADEGEDGVVQAVRCRAMTESYLVTFASGAADLFAPDDIDALVAETGRTVPLAAAAS